MKNLRPNLFLGILLSIIFLAGIPYAVNAQTAHGLQDRHSSIHHVLLISVDGLHAVDLKNYTSAYPNSALATLSKDGITYTNASTTTPSDSFPGILSITTGGTPRSTGVF